MNLKSIQQLADDFINTSEYNKIQSNYAIKKDYVGIKMFDIPLIKIGNAKDPMFLEFKKKML